MYGSIPPDPDTERLPSGWPHIEFVVDVSISDRPDTAQLIPGSSEESQAKKIKTNSNTLALLSRIPSGFIGYKVFGLKVILSSKFILIISV
jgi:hypothetical protein